MSARSATTFARLAALEDADDTCVGDPRLHLQTETAQVVGDDLGGARLLHAQLGMLMEVASPGDHLRKDLRRGAIDGGRQGQDTLGHRRGGTGQQGEHESRNRDAHGRRLSRAREFYYRAS
ncbi:MAG: hypothetical protein R2712_17385 [Vicinamibacterales bacterium]